MGRSPHVIPFTRAYRSPMADERSAGMTEQKPIITFRVSANAEAPIEEVYDVLANLSTHLDWAGTGSSREDFRLLTLDAPHGRASTGTEFTSTGASSKNGSMTYHDRSVVTDASAPARFAFDTHSVLERRHRPDWPVR